MNFRNLILGILLVCLVTVVFAPNSGRDSRGDSDYNTQYIHTIPTNLPENTIPVVKEIELPTKKLIPYSTDTGENREQESDVCKDSDGSNPNKAGSVEYYTLINGVKYNKNTINDFCSYADLSVVHEAICNDGKGDYTTLSCATGETCQGGKCTGTQTPEPEPECDANNDCAQTEYCSNEECLPVSEGECGYVSNHKWNEYECCANSDCSSDEECVSHECKEKEEPLPECVTNADCPSGYECKNGECKEKQTPTVSCTDSDGEDLFTLGKAQKGHNILQDTCSREKVKEAVCIHNIPTYKILECGAGYECSAGVCVKEAPEPENECSADNDCKDNEYCMKNKEGNECLPVSEGECGYVSNHKWNEYECCANSDCSSDEECVSHECKEKEEPTPQISCTDSDGGEKLFRFGTAQKGRSILPDTCYRGKVKEAVCIHNIPTYKILECGTGYTCDAGVCIKEKPKDECTTNHDCANDEYCSFKVNGNKCLPVVEGECGYVDLHVWNEYECCEDSECSTGYDCSEHKCVLGEEAVSLSCSDSDFGKTQFGFGVLTYTYSIEDAEYTEQYHDTCVDESTVLEYYCSGKDYKTQEMGCPLAYTCSGGNCVKNEEVPECTLDTDCSEGYICTNGECVEKEEPVPECVTDSDCSQGNVCTNGECTEEVVTPECTSNEQCAEDESCMLGATPKNNECLPVVEGECGYISNHQWNDYECCADSDCSEGYVCLTHECTDMDLWDDFFGYDVCTDSDNGFDVLVPGSTNHKHYLMGFVSFDELKRDECDPTDVTKIIEYACDETNHIITQTLSCGEGKACVTEEGASYCKDIPVPPETGCVAVANKGATFNIDNQATSESSTVTLYEGEEVEMFGAKVKLLELQLTASCPAGWQTQEECTVGSENARFELTVGEQFFEFNIPVTHVAILGDVWVEPTEAIYTLTPCPDEQKECYYTGVEDKGTGTASSCEALGMIEKYHFEKLIPSDSVEIYSYPKYELLISGSLNDNAKVKMFVWHPMTEIPPECYEVINDQIEFNLGVNEYQAVNIEGEQEYAILVTDAAPPQTPEDLGWVTVSVCEPNEPEQPPIEYYTISLNKGWNMFSVPYSKVTLEGATGTCTEICSFTKENFWAFTEYINPYGDYTQLLSSDELIGGTDYWFNAADACEVNLPIVDNTEYTYTDKLLKSGINALAGPSESASVEHALSGCSVVAVATYANGEWSNGLTVLEPGKGYLVMVESDCILSGSNAS